MSDNREMQNFNSNLKKTSLGVHFTKTLFTDPGSMSPSTIKSVLQTLGLKFSDDQILTADMAQIIVSGEAVNSGLQAGSSASDLGNSVNLTGAAFKGLTAIAESKGWIDSDTASILQIGTDVTLIVSSAGANVFAWIGLALDVSQAVGSKQALADMRAQQDAQNKLSGLISGQAKIFAKNFKSLQEGNLSIYGFFASLAADSPAIWPQVINPKSPLLQYFPELKFVPVVTKQVTGYGEASISGDWPWPGSGSYIIDRWTSSKSLSYSSLQQNFDKESASAFIYHLLVEPWVQAYAIVNNEVVSKGHASIEDVAILTALVKPDGRISATRDYVSLLMGTHLTPYDMGYSILDQLGNEYLQTSYQGQDTQYHEQAVTASGSLVNAGFRNYNQDQEVLLQKLQQVRQSSNIRDLVSVPFVFQKLQSFLQFPATSFELDPSIGNKVESKFSGQSLTAWRSLHNYISVLQILDQFRTDSYLKSTVFAQNLDPFMPSLDSFNSRFLTMNYLHTTRAVNLQARKRIAELLGVPLSKLKLLTPRSLQGPAIFSY